MKTQVLSIGTAAKRAEAVQHAVQVLRRGDIVALPTETVYGLAADALNPAAVARIFEAKERPRFDPLIVHVPHRECLKLLTKVPAQEQQLVEALINAFWPGPLTFVLPRQAIVPDIVAAGLSTVAVRMSADVLFSDIIREFGKPLAAPSANRFGRISPTTAAHALAELNNRIPLVVDGGATTHGIESTIVAVRENRIEILRHGPVTEEELARFGQVRIAARRDLPEAPGQLPSHYAPRTPLKLTRDLRSFVADAERVGALAFASSPTGDFAATRVLSPSGDLVEAAANLFRYLRELDDAGLDLIVAEELPQRGLGTAIMERLRRASAPG